MWYLGNWAPSFVTALDCRQVLKHFGFSPGWLQPENGFVWSFQGPFISKGLEFYADGLDAFSREVRLRMRNPDFDYLLANPSVPPSLPGTLSSVNNLFLNDYYFKWFNPTLMSAILEFGWEQQKMRHMAFCCLSIFSILSNTWVSSFPGKTDTLIK